MVTCPYESSAGVQNLRLEIAGSLTNFIYASLSYSSTFMGIFLFFLGTICFFSSLLSRTLRKSAKPFIISFGYQKKHVDFIQLSLYYLLTVEYRALTPITVLDLFTGTKIAYVRGGGIKVPIIEEHNSINHFDLFAVSKSMLNSDIKTYTDYYDDSDESSKKLTRNCLLDSTIPLIQEILDLYGHYDR